LQTKELIRALCSIMTISGQEYRSADKIRELVGDVYDEYKAYPNGNFIFIRHSSSPADGEKPILLLDAHYDEIGMMVTEIKDGGFLRVTSVGGLKSSILLGGEVTIYAKEELYGVVCVTPPHLQKPGDSEKLPAINEIMIDTGFSKEELTERGVEIGTPVGFPSVPVDMLNGMIADKALDDKCCAAAAIKALELLDNTDIPCDIYFLLSCKEEIGGLGGCTGAYDINPDAAIVLDVDFASVPDTPRHKTIKLGEGPSVTLSAVTNRALTRSILNCARRNDIKCQQVVSASSTGTNADDIAFARGGIPTAVLSIPEKNMHTYSEVVSVDDVDETARLIAKFVTDGFADWLADPHKVMPLYERAEEKSDKETEENIKNG